MNSTGHWEKLQRTTAALQWGPIAGLKMVSVFCECLLEGKKKHFTSSLNFCSVSSFFFIEKFRINCSLLTLKLLLLSYEGKECC